jgi:putative ABC transport system permease protein
VAAERRLVVGATVQSDLRNLYNLAGSYPVLLEVVGILASAGTPDDDVLFADLATSWALDGRVHGHGEVSASDLANPASASIDPAEAENLEATAALFLFHRIDASNRDQFHLHGDRDQAPVTSLLLFPLDQRARDLALGEYALDPRLQAVRPVAVVRTVLGLVLRAARVLDAYFVVVAGSTAALIALVVTLSLRLRRRELDLMRRIGASRGAAVVVIGLEIGMILLTAVLLSALLAWAGVGWLGARIG